MGEPIIKKNHNYSRAHSRSPTDARNRSRMPTTLRWSQRPTRRYGSRPKTAAATFGVPSVSCRSLWLCGTDWNQHSSHRPKRFEITRRVCVLRPSSKPRTIGALKRMGRSVIAAPHRAARRRASGQRLSCQRECSHFVLAASASAYTLSHRQRGPMLAFLLPMKARFRWFVTGRPESTPPIA